MSTPHPVASVAPSRPRRRSGRRRIVSFFVVLLGAALVYELALAIDPPEGEEAGTRQNDWTHAEHLAPEAPSAGSPSVTDRQQVGRGVRP